MNTYMHTNINVYIHTHKYSYWHTYLPTYIAQHKICKLYRAEINTLAI